MKDNTKASYKLPAEAYLHQSWLDNEKLNIFAASGLFADRASALPDPEYDKISVQGLMSGSLYVMAMAIGMLFITLVVTELLVWSVVNVILLFCPYHKWGYGLDGDLRGGPQREQLDNLNLKELGLHKASVESWMGLLFVHADEQPGLSFAQWSIGLADKLAAFEVDQLLLLKQESFTFESKWKLYIKNHADWPHLGYVHRETLGRLEHSEEKIM